MIKKSDTNNDACIIGFNDRWVWMIGLPIIGAMIPILFFEISPSDDWISYLQLVMVSMFHGIVFWSVGKWLLIALRKSFPDHKDYIKRILLQILIISSSTYLISYMSCYLMDIFPVGLSDEFSPSNGEVYFASYAITYFILLLYETMYFFDLWKIGILENEKLKTENTKAQLTVLKNQVNPHFLFNSLNTLASVIPDNPQLAIVFVEKLSAVYRYILEIKNKELISLREELDCIEAFEFLLKIRFGDKLIIKKEISKNDELKYIVPMALQMLIENAVKHNVVSSSHPLVIDIYTKDNTIFVDNIIKLKSNVHDSTETGLENIKERYKLITGREAVWQELNGRFVVRLPLVEVGEY